jgi:copper resistance protein B
MHITNFVFKAFFSVAVLSLTSLSLAHEGHHSTAQTDGKNVPSMNMESWKKQFLLQHWKRSPTG